MLIKEYIITSPTSMAVSVFVSYNMETTLLVSVRFEGAGAKKIEAFGRQIPYSMQNLLEKSKKLGWKLEEIDLDLSFERFYEEYNYKHGKKRAEARWKKMRKEDKVKALIYIEKYKNHLKLRPGQDPKYPESYLNAEPWND